MLRDVIDSQDALIDSEGDQVTGRVQSVMNEEARTHCKYSTVNRIKSCK